MTSQPPNIPKHNARKKQLKKLAEAGIIRRPRGSQRATSNNTILQIALFSTTIGIAGAIVGGIVIGGLVARNSIPAQPIYTTPTTSITSVAANASTDTPVFSTFEPTQTLLPTVTKTAETIATTSSTLPPTALPTTLPPTSTSIPPSPQPTNTIATSTRTRTATITPPPTKTEIPGLAACEEIAGMEIRQVLKIRNVGDTQFYNKGYHGWGKMEGLKELPAGLVRENYSGSQPIGTPPKVSPTPITDDYTDEDAKALYFQIRLVSGQGKPLKERIRIRVENLWTVENSISSATLKIATPTKPSVKPLVVFRNANPNKSADDWLIDEAGDFTVEISPNTDNEVKQINGVVRVWFEVEKCLKGNPTDRKVKQSVVIPVAQYRMSFKDSATAKIGYLFDFSLGIIGSDKTQMLFVNLGTDNPEKNFYCFAAPDRSANCGGVGFNKQGGLGFVFWVKAQDQKGAFSLTIDAYSGLEKADLIIFPHKFNGTPQTNTIWLKEKEKDFRAYFDSERYPCVGNQPTNCDLVMGVAFVK